MSKSLFNDFKEVSAKEWKQKIQVDLKGGDYDQLIFHTPEGIDVKPFYHQDDSPKTALSAVPANWKIAERFTLTDDDFDLQKLQNSIEKGAEKLWITITSDQIDIQKVLDAVEAVPVYLEFTFLQASSLKQLEQILSQKTYALSLGIDIIGQLAATGNWFQSLEKDYELLQQFLNLQQYVHTCVAINTQVYQQGGANNVQQLAYAMAHVTEYLQFIETKAPTHKNRFRPIFKCAIGSNYFFEIAKLKALRNLYASIAAAFDAPEKIEILAFPTARNKTLYDYNVNLLRTTTECMSAVLGGADTVCNFRYDEIYHHDNEFGRRIARNQLLILKKESYFDKVGNPTDGAYYIESITEQLSEKALALFKDIENGGGFLAALKEGTIQRKIKESAQKEEAQVVDGKYTLVGTNKYNNKDDKMKHELEKDPFLQKEKRKTLLPPVIQKRLSEKLEKERLQQED